MQQVSTFFNAPRQYRPDEKPLTDFERDAVVYFFAKLKIADSRFYDQIMPDETTERIVKREFAGMIRGFSKEKIDNGFRELNKLIASNHPEYKFLKIQSVIGLVANNGAQEASQAGAARQFESLYDPNTGTYRLEDQTAKAKRYETGLKNTSALLAMLSESSPEKTESETELTYGQEQLAKAKTMLESGQ